MDITAVFIIVLEALAFAGVIWGACLLRRALRPLADPNTPVPFPHIRWHRHYHRHSRHPQYNRFI